MPNLKWVIAMSGCAITGGPYWESYAIIGSADQKIEIS